MVKNKLFYTKGVKQVKAHLQNSNVIEGTASKFWYLETMRVKWLELLK